jgi:hypothetical protein
MTKQAADIKDVQFIAPDAYPQMVSKQDAARAMQTLRSAQAQVKAQVAMDSAVPPMRAAILQYVDELEAAGTDLGKIFTLGHEIRGFAATAGLVTTGRISEILCNYMDDMERLKRPADATIVALHVAAIARAARAEEDDARMGEVVAAELAGLVAKRIADAAGR